MEIRNIENNMEPLEQNNDLRKEALAPLIAEVKRTNRRLSALIMLIGESMGFAVSGSNPQSVQHMEQTLARVKDLFNNE